MNFLHCKFVFNFLGNQYLLIVGVYFSFVDTCGKEADKQDEKREKSSKTWEFFEELKGYPLSFEKAKCKFYGVVIGCNTNRNGTSAMMNLLKTVCAKSPSRTNLDKLQKTLKFEKLSKDDKFQTLQRLIHLIKRN